MKRLSFASLVLFALVTSSVSADPRPLSDDQLDQITAGTAGDRENPTSATGGNMIAGEATATIAGEATVSLQDNAQIGAQALSLVSSADSAVANGVNLWDGAVQDLSIGAGLNVLQSNELFQDSKSPYASLNGYERDEGTLRDVQVWADSTAPVQTIDFGLQLNVDGLGSFDGRGEIPAAVIPGAKIPGSFGNVVGFAGELGIDFDGGSFATGFTLDTYVAAEAHLSSTTSSSILWGLINTGSGSINSRTRVSGNFNPYMTINWELPDLSIIGEGAVCYANAGDCLSSVLERDIAAMRMSWASAENIVVDRSTLDSANNYSVALGGEAQASARAVTLVNAAGGLVANSTNLATASDTGLDGEPGAGAVLATELLDLNQDNAVQQTRGIADDRGRHALPTNPGGTIVANESGANLIDTRSVIVTDAAQAGARAVSLVNSADTLVATGVNVWDGRLQDSSIGNRIEIAQSNELVQIDGQSSASLGWFDRGSESSYHAWTDTASAASPKYLGTEFTLDILDPETQVPVASLTGNLNIPASIIPTSKIPGLGGTSAGFAGNVDVHLDGGSADFSFGIEESGLHFLSENSITGGGSLGIFDVGGSGWFNVYTDVTIEGALDLHIDMPDLDIEVDGAACFAQKGSCDAGVMDREIGDLFVAIANAEYIVLDRSTLNADSVSRVTLDNGAQADARAVNLFNTTGGLIAGGTNIASWRGEENTLTTPLLNLQQENNVTQTPGIMGRHGTPGGVIVAYESAAGISDSASVAVMNEAQRGARALSLVNSADAMVANGLNVWSGNLTDATFDDSINVSQSNFLVQQFAAPAAGLGFYHREDEWARDVQTSITTKSPAGPPDDFYPPADPRHINGEVRLEFADIVNFNRTGWVPTSIIPTSKIPGGKPGGIAFAGDGYLHYDGGGFELVSTTGSHFSSTTTAGANGSVSAFFGLADASGTSTWSEHSEIDLTTILDIGVDMPDLTIDVNGAGCIVKGADCFASVIERQDGDLTVLAAAAEYIVLDRSVLNVNSDYGVALSGQAQADAEALLILNAAGGHIANGFNVSRIVANSLLAQPNLAQSNLILQGVDLDGVSTSEGKDETATGGTIVAAESMATMHRSGSVSLDTSAQDNARALLLVNSADALVANGINVWHGDLEAADFGHAINLMQTNQVYQYAAPTTARLYGYDRDSSQLYNAYSIADSRAEPQYIRAGFEIDIPGIGSYYEGMNIPASAIPNSKIPGTRGMVTGFAGEVDVVYGGGSVDVLFGIDGHFGYNNELYSSAAAGDFLGFGNVSGTTSIGVDEITMNFAPTFFFNADLPTLEIHADGALCWANGGTCQAGVLEEDRGELSIDSAVAENIVVDRAVLDVTESYSVALDNGAQAHAQAMAIVNAAGGLVANGINVSNLSGSTLNSSTVNIVQRNVIVQGK